MACAETTYSVSTPIRCVPLPKLSKPLSTVSPPTLSNSLTLQFQSTEGAWPRLINMRQISCRTRYYGYMCIVSLSVWRGLTFMTPPSSGSKSSILSTHSGRQYTYIHSNSSYNPNLSEMGGAEILPILFPNVLQHYSDCQKCLIFSGKLKVDDFCLCSWSLHW